MLQTNLHGFILHRFRATKDSVSIIPEAIHSKYVRPFNEGTLDKSSTLQHRESGYIFGMGGSRIELRIKRPLNGR